MTEYITKGIVKNFERINERFSFVTLIRMPNSEVKWAETRMPIYIKEIEKKDLMGEPIEIREEEKGGIMKPKEFTQRIITPNLDHQTTLPMKIVVQIRETSK
jgi:hypothetical protein